MGSWSYSGDPAASDLDQVRFYVQDTNEAAPLLSDEEISFVLAQWTDAFDSPLWAAAVCAETVAAKFVQLVSVSADGVSVDLSSLTEKYNALAGSLRDQYHALYGNQGPSVEAMLGLGTDPTIEPLTFGVGFQDNFWAGRQDFGDREYAAGVDGAGW